MQLSVKHWNFDLPASIFEETDIIYKANVLKINY